MKTRFICAKSLSVVLRRCWGGWINAVAVQLRAKLHTIPDAPHRRLRVSLFGQHCAFYDDPDSVVVTRYLRGFTPVEIPSGSG